LAPDKLIDNPRIGQTELALKDRMTPYQSNYKIIYSIDEENHLIKIADVFDTRQQKKYIGKNKTPFQQLKGCF